MNSTRRVVALVGMVLASAMFALAIMLPFMSNHSLGSQWWPQRDERHD